MNISNARATIGLNARATPSKGGSSGNIQIGDNNKTIALTTATKIVSFEAVIAGAASDLVVDIINLDNSGSAAWTPGSAQIESATVVLGTPASGTLNFVVSSVGMTGHPLTVPVTIDSAVQTTAALYAQKIVDTLNANTVVAARFTATRSSASVLLTRKPSKTYTVNGTSVPLYLAGNADEFTIPTALGVTGATSTTGGGAAAGVLTVGTYAPDLDGTDFEGKATGGMANVQGVLITNDVLSDVVIVSQAAAFQGFNISEGNMLQFGGAFYVDNGDITIATFDNAKVQVTLAGS